MLGVEALVTVVVVVEAVGVAVLVVVVVEAAGVVDVVDLLDVVEFSVVGFGVCVCGVCSAASATTKVPVADAPSLNWNAMVCACRKRLQVGRLKRQYYRTRCSLPKG